MDQTDTFALFGSSATTMLSMLIFLATGTLAFAVMIGVRAREAVRRRAARVNIDDDVPGGRRSLRYSGQRAVQKLIEYTTKHYSSVDTENVKMLRRRLMQAGIYNPHGAACFFITRGVAAVGSGRCGIFCFADAGIWRQSAVLAFRHGWRTTGLSRRRASISIV